MIIDAVFPRFCVSCRREGPLLCRPCLDDFSADGPPFAYANPVIRQLICAWKYEGDNDGLRVLWTLMLSRLSALRALVATERLEAIVPVPLSKWKERWRGFHQVRDLAHILGKELSLPTVDCLERRHRFVSQADLSHVDRTKSFQKRTFFVKVSAVVPQRILLIDDVQTTGATMNAVAEVLRETAGVEAVVTWSLARG